MVEGEKPEAAAEQPASAGGSRRGKRGKDRARDASRNRSAGQCARHARRILSSEAEIENPFQGSALTMLQIVYKDPRQPTEVRLKAARDALPYESPRLSTVEHGGAIGVLTHEEALAQLAKGKKPDGGGTPPAAPAP